MTMIKDKKSSGFGLPSLALTSARAISQKRSSLIPFEQVKVMPPVLVNSYLV
jgi:hypothetical protein